MTKMKTKVKHQSKAKHKIKVRSASSNLHCLNSLGCTLLTLFPAMWVPLRFSPNPRFDNESIRRWASKRAAPKLETIQPQSKTVSLSDLPLELLYMIFDHVTCKDRLKRRRYTIRVVPEGASIDNSAIPQHPLLMVCSSLRSRLISYFYSISFFHVEIHMSSMVKNNHGFLDLRQLQEQILYQRKLSSLKLTINIYELSRKFFDYSVLVQMGKMLFEDYRNKRLMSRYEAKLIKLRWRLKCNDPEFDCPCPRRIVEQDLRRLLDKIHKWAAKTALHTSKSSQTFGSKLERWLRTQEDTVDSTYYIRRMLDQCFKATSVYERQLALESYYFKVKCTCG